MDDVKTASMYCGVRSLPTYAGHTYSHKRYSSVVSASCTCMVGLDRTGTWDSGSGGLGWAGGMTVA